VIKQGSFAVRKANRRATPVALVEPDGAAIS
jgi:hypothetical protein